LVLAEPWFVLVALWEAKAVNEDAATASDALLKRMTNAGVRLELGLRG
jgi:hypothetical protein